MPLSLVNDKPIWNLMLPAPEAGPALPIHHNEKQEVSL